MTTQQDGFIKSLFFGDVREDLVFPYPRLSPETQETVDLINDSIDRFAEEHVDAAQWDRDSKMPDEIIQRVSELGLMGLLVDEEYNGLGLPMTAYGKIFERIGKHDTSLTVTVGAHQSIGYKSVLLFGSDEQKARFLPRLAAGELIASFCLTEPSSGSDAASIRSKAVLSEDGSHYILNGSKIWITNGGIANFLTVFAKVDVDDNGTTKEKVTCFVLELPTEGVTVGPPEDKMGCKASWTNAVFFDNVKIPAENVILAPGKGFKVAVGVLNHGRLGLAAGCISGMKNCIQASVQHATARKQFGMSLIEFGMIQDKIGRMAVDLYAVESMVYLTTHLIDRGDVDYYLESAAAKVFSTEALWKAVDENIQIWGGNGYMREYPYERWMRDVRIFRIWEGTNEILRAFVALAGLRGPGEELAGLADALKYPLKGLGPVSEFAIRKIKRSVLGETIAAAHPSLHKITSIVEDATAEFAAQTEAALRRHGRDIWTAQFAQKRLADIAIDLFALVCVLSRTSSIIEARGGADKCEFEVTLAETFTQLAKHRVFGNLKEMQRNEDDHLKAIAGKIAEMGEYSTVD